VWRARGAAVGVISELPARVPARRAARAARSRRGQVKLALSATAQHEPLGKLDEDLVQVLQRQRVALAPPPVGHDPGGSTIRSRVCSRGSTVSRPSKRRAPPACGSAARGAVFRYPRRLRSLLALGADCQRDLSVSGRGHSSPQHCSSVNVVPHRPGSCSSASAWSRSACSSSALTSDSSRSSREVANCSGRRR
jgi:hypothetical protein